MLGKDQSNRWIQKRWPIRGKRSSLTNPWGSKITEELMSRLLCEQKNGGTSQKKLCNAKLKKGK